MCTEKWKFPLAFILLPFIAVTLGTTGHDNKGTEFIFGIMYNYEREIENYILEVFMTTDIDEDIQVTVELPVYNSTFRRIVMVRKNIVRKVVLSSDLMNHNSGQADNKGIRVSAMREIMAYASHGHKLSVDAFLLLPVHVSGNEYYIMSWKSRSAFLIIGIEDDTKIAIAFSQHSSFTENVSQNSTINIILKKFQTFYFYDTDDLTGTHINSSKPVSVISGNTCGELYYGRCDHMSQQLIPVSKWGYDFIAIGMPNCGANDTFRVLASELNTFVNIAGSTNVELSEAGDFFSFNFHDAAPFKVTSDKPITLVLYPNGMCNPSQYGDPSSIPIPAVSQYSADYTVETIELTGVEVISSLTIIINNDDTYDLRIDGEIINSTDWTNVSGTNDMVYTDFTITSGTHTIKHLNSTVTFMVFLTGIQRHVSYGMPLGYSLGHPAKVSLIATKPLETLLIKLERLMN